MFAYPKTCFETTLAVMKFKPTLNTLATNYNVSNCDKYFAKSMIILEY